MSERFYKYVAFHEAGHAVAAFAMGAEIECAELKPNRVGVVTLGHFGCARMSIEESFRMALVFLAGPCAERMVNRWPWGAYAIGGYLAAERGDAMHDIARAYEEVGKEDAWEIFFPMANRLVTSHRGAVEALAEELLKRKVLSGKKVESILHRADRKLGDSIEKVRAMVPPGTAGYQPGSFA